MILVDSSVWIDYFRGIANPQTKQFDSLLLNQPLVTGDLILTEVLQGFENPARLPKGAAPAHATQNHRCGNSHLVH
ncbi:MAG: hypothetical protein SGI92_31110 [Bryobacteraceae bacterium]|nr:hypothetical protein [Bryobacteraceae bacterium]